jgi:hypothetical protein
METAENNMMRRQLPLVRGFRDGRGCLIIPDRSQQQNPSLKSFFFANFVAYKGNLFLKEFLPMSTPVLQCTGVLQYCAANLKTIVDLRLILER